MLLTSPLLLLLLPSPLLLLLVSPLLLLQVGLCHMGDYVLSQLDCCCPHLTKLVMTDLDLHGTGVAWGSLLLAGEGKLA